MTRTRRFVRLVSCVTVVLVLLAARGVADDHGKSVTISKSNNGEGIVVAVSAALAKGVLEGAIRSRLDCASEVDPEFGKLLRTLDRGGRGSRATMEDSETRIAARRKGKTLRLDIRDLDDGGKIEAVIPWAVAECLLGRSTEVDTSMAKIRVKIKGAEGGSFEFKVD